MHNPDPGSACAAEARLRAIARLRFAPRKRRLLLCLVAASIRAGRSHEELAFSSLRDYVAARGMRGSTFQDDAAAGELFLSVPRARALYRDGELSIPVAALITRRVRPPVREAAVEACRGQSLVAARKLLQRPGSESESTIDETPLHRVKLRVPLPVADYIRSTLELAGAIEGAELPPDQRVAAVVAEASTEFPFLVEEPEAVSRFHLSSDQLASRPAPGSRGSRPSLRLHGGRRSIALRLDAMLRHLLLRLRQERTWLEEQLYEASLQNLHGQFGYGSFVAFAAAELDLPTSTVWEYVSAARARRRDCPLARAEKSGIVGPVQADLLRRLVRLGVPRSALPPWIHAASRTTVRRLRRMVSWARVQADHDYASWSLRDFPPPTDREIRTTDPSPSQIAASPDPPSPQALRDAPMTTLTLHLESDCLVLLLREMATLQDLAQTRREEREQLFTPRPPTWWALLRVFHLAREAWTQIQPAEGYRFARILERDRYRCQAPGCTRRRNLESHHIHYQGQGGGDEDTNLLTLCHTHHQHGEHRGRLRVRGTAAASALDSHQLRWEMGFDAHGEPLAVFNGEEERID